VAVVDLAATAAACQPLAAWWRSFEAGAEDLHVLESARRTLLELTPPPGPVGGAVAAIGSGVRQATRAELLEAMRLLVRIAGWRTKPGPRLSPSRRRTQRQRVTGPCQLQLPGFERDAAR
jgi:hypothetical protein